MFSIKWYDHFRQFCKWAKNLRFGQVRLGPFLYYPIHCSFNHFSWAPLVHRCTRVENPREGVRDVFAKIPRGGVKGFRKNCQGGYTYFAFYCIFFNKFFKNLPGGLLFHPPPPSPLPPPPVCIYASLVTVINFPKIICQYFSQYPKESVWFI